MKIARHLLALAVMLSIAAAVSGCSPDKAMDFGPAGEIDTAPQDELSRQILRDFDAHEFMLGENDREAEVSLVDWPPGKRITIPFWFGINPLMPYFHRPTVGRIYVMSESVLVRELGKGRYFIRAGSKAFKNDTISKRPIPATSARARCCRRWYALLARK